MSEGVVQRLLGMERHPTQNDWIWEALFEYHPRLTRLAARYGSQTPEDHAQDTLVRMAPHVDRFSTPLDALKYANRVVVNIVKDEHRRSRRIEIGGLDGMETEPTVSNDSDQTAEVIQRYVNQSGSEAFVDVATLLIEGYDQTEIAPMVGRSRDSVVRVIDKIAAAMVAEDPTVLEGRVGRRARRMSAA